MKKSAGAFITHHKKLLLLLRDNNPEIENPDCWQLIGGQCDNGETTIETLMREIREETNIKIKNEYIEKIGKIIIPNEQEYEIFWVKFSDEEVKNTKLGNEGQKIEFISPDEFENMKLIPHFANYCKRYKEGLEKLVKEEILDKKLLGFNEDNVFTIQ